MDGFETWTNIQIYSSEPSSLSIKRYENVKNIISRSIENNVSHHSMNETMWKSCSINNDTGGMGMSYNARNSWQERYISTAELGPQCHSPPSALSGRRVQRSPL